MLVGTDWPSPTYGAASYVTKRVAAAKVYRSSGIERRISDALERRQPLLECILDLFGIGRSQTALGAENPMRPRCGLLGGANVLEVGRKLVPQSGRGLGAKG